MEERMRGSCKWSNQMMRYKLQSNFWTDLSYLKYIVEEEECEGVTSPTTAITQLYHIHFAHVHSVRCYKVGLQ